MPDIRREVRQSVYALLDRLELFRDADPSSPLGEAAADFNRLLEAAKRAFPDSDTIRALRPLTAADWLVTMVTRLATLKGAIDAELYSA